MKIIQTRATELGKGKSNMLKAWNKPVSWSTLYYPHSNPGIISGCP